MEYQDNDRPPDVLGIASLVCGALAGAGCIGTCVPYLGILFMMGSMLLSLVGAILGAVGTMQQNAKGESNALSLGGVVMNGVVLLLWLAYWIFTFGVVIVAFGLMFVAILLDA